jgi:hypothetical protein
MNLQDFSRYLLTRSSFMEGRKKFYENKVHTTLKWYTFLNTQRSEQKVLTRMTELYGKDHAIVLGDWSDAGHTAKYQQSSKTRGWRKLFARNRIPCYLIDEYKTSSVCSKCGSGVGKNFKSRPSSRPWRRKQGHKEKVHGLLGCTTLLCMQQGWTRRL